MTSIPFLTFLTFFVITNANKIPDYLPRPCRKSAPDYSGCTLEALRKMGPHLIKGVPEMNFPNMNPWHAPPLTLNMNFSRLFGMSVSIKNARMWDFDGVKLDDFKFDTETMSGELVLKWPRWRIAADYEATSRPFSFDLIRAGSMESNITNSVYHFKFSLRPVRKRDAVYYEFENFKAKISTGDARIGVTSKNPAGQPFANLLSNLYNANSHRALVASHDYCEESVRVVYKSLMDGVLNTVPAQELIPE